MVINKPIQALKPPDNTDDAARRLGESQPPCLRMDALLGGVSGRYDPTKDGNGNYDNIRNIHSGFGVGVAR